MYRMRQSISRQVYIATAAANHHCKWIFNRCVSPDFSESISNIWNECNEMQQNYSMCTSLNNYYCNYFYILARRRSVYHYIIFHIADTLQYLCTNRVHLKTRFSFINTVYVMIIISQH